jgi:hypothetical protein
MHFWNKLSTAALMRLTVLASLNLIMLRLVGRWDILLHPWFFLSMVTLDLGLYSVMVYSGTLNKTLIGMMLGGLAATLGTLVYTGMGASAFGVFCISPRKGIFQTLPSRDRRCGRHFAAVAHCGTDLDLTGIIPALG